MNIVQSGFQKVPVLTGDDTGTTALKETLSSCRFLLYTTLLYFCFVSGLGYGGYTIYDLATNGLRDPSDYQGEDFDMTILISLFLTVSHLLTFYVGIKARTKLDHELQNKFFSYIRLLGELYIFMGGFYLASILFFPDLEETVIAFEKIDLIFIGANLALFVFVYLRARELANRLNEIYDPRRKI